MTTTGTLAGKTALVTGAGSGLGRASALALAREGASVIVTELPDRLDRAEETVAMLDELGVDGAALPLDVRDLASIERCVADAAANGRLDILVNNAGVNVQKLAFDVTESDWDTVVDTNLKGVFFVAQAAGRVMRDQSPAGGCMVNIASIMGLVGYQHRAAYCSSKAGVVNLTRVLAIEWARYGIRVNAVCPTFVETPLVIPYFERHPEVRDDVLARMPAGRLGTPEEIAAAVVFLCTPGAAMITGHPLTVDGGWTAW
jgi:NAD(P)-dependent dehydrogenase (short-subunit alcohol dehydrogenase family)